jgi:chorismate synthase
MTRLRFLTAGESHGPCLTFILEGVPAGLPLCIDDVNADLARRQRGYGRGARMKIETDTVHVVGGVRHGETLGGPIAMRIDNADFENWRERMSAEPSNNPGEPLLRPRPGHADLSGGQKYGRKDLRDILERASARETAARTAVGAVCKQLLKALDVELAAHVVAIGDVVAKEVTLDAVQIGVTARASDLACVDEQAAERMRDAIRTAAHQGDTLGGVFEVVAAGLPPGLGSHVQWDRKLDGRIAQALMSLQAIKGVEFGDGFRASARAGSQVHDGIAYRADERRYYRLSNHAGGIEGGMTNGENLVVRAAMKPIATLRKPLPSVQIDTKEATLAAFERSDVCAVAAASVVGEAIVATVLADAALEKFGGDSLLEVVRNANGYRAQLAAG